MDVWVFFFFISPEENIEADPKSKESSVAGREEENKVKCLHKVECSECPSGGHVRDPVSLTTYYAQPKRPSRSPANGNKNALLRRPTAFSVRL